MAGINKVIIVGRLGQDVELRHTANNDPIATISVATSDIWTDKTGNKQEKTEWHRVVMFGKLADIANQYLKKGSQVYIEGKLRTNKWQDRDGNDRYTTEIIITPFEGKMQMLDSKGSSTQNNNNYNNSTESTQINSNNQAEITPIDSVDDYDDDIPF